MRRGTDVGEGPGRRVFARAGRAVAEAAVDRRAIAIALPAGTAFRECRVRVVYHAGRGGGRLHAHDHDGISVHGAVGIVAEPDDQRVPLASRERGKGRGQAERAEAFPALPSDRGVAGGELLIHVHGRKRSAAIGDRIGGVGRAVSGRRPGGVDLVFRGGVHVCEGPLRRVLARAGGAVAEAAVDRRAIAVTLPSAAAFREGPIAVVDHAGSGAGRLRLHNRDRIGHDNPVSIIAEAHGQRAAGSRVGAEAFPTLPCDGGIAGGELLVHVHGG